MLQKPNNPTVNCLANAAEAERRVAEAAGETLRMEYEYMAKGWRLLASRCQLQESLERFLLDAEQAKGLVSAKASLGTESPAALPSGEKFDPKTLSLLTSAYTKAMADEPAVRKVITRHIIELACEGERDPDLLYRRAVARSKPPVASRL